MGTLCTVLLSVYSGTCLPIFIEIGSYLIDSDTEQKISWHSFFLEIQCIIIINWARIDIESRMPVDVCREARGRYVHDLWKL